MNQNSYLARFVAENPDYEEKLKEKNVKVKKSGDLAIFNYEIEADFSDALVQEARGLILNTKTLEVVCWPFRKFGNYGESYVDEIDWNTARVQEKMDGSIVKLYYYEGKWNFATDGCIYANEAWLMDRNMTFLDLIQSAENYKDIPFDKLNKEMTYIFEITSPFNRIVIPYETASLFHLGTRSNLTGEEFACDIGIKKPQEYSLTSLEDCIMAANQLNQNGYTKHEGFVVVDNNYHRIKIKTPEYLLMHHVFSNYILTLEKAVEIVQKGEVEEISSYFPHHKETLCRYSDLYHAVMEDIREELLQAEHIWNQIKPDRKSYAMWVKTTTWHTFELFQIADGKSVESVLESIPCKRMVHYVEKKEKALANNNIER